MLKPKKLALERSQELLNAASNITHSAIADQESSRVATNFNVHCTVHCTVEDLNVKRSESQRKVGTIPYRTVCMISRVGAQHPGTATGAGVCSALQSSVRYHEL